MSETGSPHAGLDGLRPGARIGPYEIRGELGRGGMGIVYRAHDPALDREVAIKVIPPNAADDRYTQRLLREARIVGRLDHPHILGVHAAGQEAAGVYIVMPLVTGESLADRLARDHCIALDEALRIVRETALALQAASEAGIVHRDIKPDNILLDARGHVKVADFGLSRDLNAQHSLTLSCDYVGTPRYSSPEQWLNQPLDVRSDIYSLGVCLFEMLTGRPAFDASSLATLMQQILGGEVPPIEVARTDIAPAVQDLLHRMMATDPDQRPATAEALVAAIDELTSGGSTAQVAATPTPQVAAPSTPQAVAPPTPQVTTPRVVTPPTPQVAATPAPTAPSAAPSGDGRGRLVAAVFVMLLFVVAGGAWWWRAHPRSNGFSVYVLDFSPRDANAPNTLDWLRVAGPDLVMGGLVKQPWLSLLSREKVELARRGAGAEARDAAAMMEVARGAGVRYLVIGTFGPTSSKTPPDAVLLKVRVLDLDSGQDIHSWDLQSTATPDEVLSTLQRAREALVQGLADTYAADHGGTRPVVAGAPSNIAWKGEAYDDSRNRQSLPKEGGASGLKDPPPGKQSGTLPPTSPGAQVKDGPPASSRPPAQGDPSENGAARPGALAAPPPNGSLPAAVSEESAKTAPPAAVSVDSAKIEALNAYARGLELACNGKSEDRKLAAEAFQKALELQPGFKEAQEALDRLQPSR